MSQNDYRLRTVGKRRQVVDAYSRGLLGSMRGDDTTGYEACKRGGEAYATDVFTTPEAAAEYIHLEFLATLELDPSTTATTTGETT